MKISFVIPAHNESELISQCIEQISRAKDQNPYEVIVVVSRDTSDDTYRIAERMGALCAQSRHSSRAIQMNEGAALASGEILCFVNADVKIPVNGQRKIAESIEKGYDSGCFSYQFDKSNKWLNMNARFTRKKRLFAGGGDQTLFIKKKTFHDLGGYNKASAIMEDFEFYERIKSHCLSYRIVPEDATVSVRKYEHNSYLKVNLVNGIIFSLYKLGIPTPTLKKWYRKMLG